MKKQVDRQVSQRSVKDIIVEDAPVKLIGVDIAKHELPEAYQRLHGRLSAQALKDIFAVDAICRKYAKASAPADPCRLAATSGLGDTR